MSPTWSKAKGGTLTEWLNNFLAPLDRFFKLELHFRSSYVILSQYIRHIYIVRSVKSEI